VVLLQQGGFCDNKSVEKKIEKGSMRTCCKGHLKAKLDKKEGY
jgi:hypothetical protein